jgi:hypothetical protein
MNIFEREKITQKYKKYHRDPLMEFSKDYRETTESFFREIKEDLEKELELLIPIYLSSKQFNELDKSIKEEFLSKEKNEIIYDMKDSTKDFFIDDELFDFFISVNKQSNDWEMIGGFNNHINTFYTTKIDKVSYLFKKSTSKIQSYSKKQSW